MRFKNKTVLVFFLMLVLTIYSATAITCPADGSTISGENILEESCTLNQWTLSANTTLDCNGFSITKNGTATAVLLNAGSNSNVTIKNCVFQSYGVTRSGNTITMSGNNTRLENNFFNETSLVQMNTANMKFISNNTFLNPFANGSSLTGLQAISTAYFSNNTLIINKPSVLNNVAGSGSYNFGVACTMEGNNVQILNVNETNFNFQANAGGTTPSDCRGQILIQNNNFSSITHTINSGGNGFVNMTQNVIIRNNNYECRWFTLAGQSNSTVEVYNNNFNKCPNYNNNTKDHNTTITVNGLSFNLNLAVPSQNYSTSYKVYNNNFNSLTGLSIGVSGTSNSSFRSNVEFYNNTINFQGLADEDPISNNLAPTRFIFTSSGGANLSVHDNYIRMRTPQNYSWIGISANRIISAQAFILGNTTPILDIYDNDFDVEGIRVTLFDDIGFNDQTYYPNVHDNNWINPNMRLYLTSGTGFPSVARVSQVVGTEIWDETNKKVLSNFINNQSQSWTNRAINGSAQPINEIIFINITGRTNNTIREFYILNAPVDNVSQTNNTYINNYWFGFSENCTDGDLNGICDSSYTVGTITDLFPLKYSSCTPDYYCSHFLACAPNNNLECDTVGDLNSCSIPYSGSAGDFNQSCSYSAPSSSTLFSSSDVGGKLAEGLFNFFLGLSAVMSVVALALVLVIYMKVKGRK